MGPEIQVQGLSKTFGNSKREDKALKNINLSIESGEMVALIGPSGSGKSTLLRHLAGLSCGDVDSGEIRVLGQLVQCQGRLSPDIRKTRARIGYIFQQFNLVGRMKVITNVLTGTLGRVPGWRGCLGLFNTEERALALKCLNRVGMDLWATQRASCLSGGQQQRVAIARTLTQKAEVILADEPIASLDPESARRVMEILADINDQDGRTVVVTLHQVEYAREFCHRAVALKAGEIVYDGPSANLTPAVLASIYGTTSFDIDGEPVKSRTTPTPTKAFALAATG
ncbi:phosphonate/organophosphate ester transporter subunit [Marinobacter psychrophilus]|jgi:phosphonate transport system ATP-binding protein|uniref:Phosphonate/organophosphate ester transporter subunit n=1 Tax=Marinobacter psychrophilus TaxID=330734 RepID=A0A0H4I037_9GAMM|nr:phosphonate ABC transporter ATP-binding protein [Marinobacter psychrophilus]AKO52294.1 phosphonate/organophosphate ester transporter subunit [Marinobacter psychrophilus]